MVTVVRIKFLRQKTPTTTPPSLSSAPVISSNLNSINLHCYFFFLPHPFRSSSVIHQRQPFMARVITYNKLVRFTCLDAPTQHSLQPLHLLQLPLALVTTMVLWTRVTCFLSHFKRRPRDPNKRSCNGRIALLPKGLGTSDDIYVIW